MVIPTAGRMDVVRGLVESLMSGTRRPDEVVVVDNAPKQADRDPGREFFDAVQVIDAGLGLNVAAARDLGWRASRSDLVLFIDDDNTVAPGALATLEAFAGEPLVGMLAPVIYSAGAPDRVWCGGVSRSMWTTHTRFLHHGAVRLPAGRSWDTLDMPNAFAVPRPVLEAVGGFDVENFPFHYEEADLGERIRRRGLRAIVVRDAAVYHQVDIGTSAGGRPGRELARAVTRDGAGRVRALSRSRVRFHWRYSRGLQRAVSLGIFIPAWLLISSADTLLAQVPLRQRAQAVWELWRGALDGIRTLSPTRA